MSPKAKNWLIVAICFVVGGALIIGGAIMMQRSDNWPGLILSGKLETSEHEVRVDFRSVSIDVDTANVLLYPSENGDCHVVCREQKKLRYRVEVTDGVLTIRAEDNRDWKDRIRFFASDHPGVTVYMPEGAYEALSVTVSAGDVAVAESFTFDRVEIAGSTGDVQCSASAAEEMNIALSTGDVELYGVSAGAIRVSVSTGRVRMFYIACDGDLTLAVTTGRASLNGVSCRSFTATGTTGDLTMTDLTAEGPISVKRTTGDVELDGCDASELTIQTDTGDVTGTLRSAKVFLVKTDTGRVDVPETTSGGACRVTTDTGDIRLSIA